MSKSGTGRCSFDFTERGEALVCLSCEPTHYVRIASRSTIPTLLRRGLLEGEAFRRATASANEQEGSLHEDRPA